LPLLTCCLSCFVVEILSTSKATLALGTHSYTILIMGAPLEKLKQIPSKALVYVCMFPENKVL